MKNKLLILGDVFGKQEEEAGRPFVGAAGFMLNQVLAMNGIAREDCYLTNVFNLRPSGGDIKSMCGPRGDAIPGLPKHGAGYIRSEFAPELTRLRSELSAIKPNLILALGPTAAWFLTGDSRISKIRGSTVATPFGKVLPTYHPSSVLREYTLRPILIADVEKAAKERAYPDVRRPQRFIHIEPNFADIQNFYRQYIAPSDALSTDVETIGTQITCIGLSPSPDRALVIPFYDPTRPGGNYWATAEEEVRVWKFLLRLFKEPRVNIGQNFLYDARFLWRSYGIPVQGMIGGDDTMLMHHSLQPEMNKGLAFLGSLYTDEAPWKLERKTDTIKKED